MDTIIQSIFLLILCTQLCYTSGQPTRTDFRQRLSEFDETLEKATHDQKVKFLESLLKNIHEKSKDANPRNANESPENLDAMKEMNAYVDSGEPQLSLNRDQSSATNSKRQKELGGKWQEDPLEDTLDHGNSDVLTPMFIGRANSGQQKQLRLPEEESDNSFSDYPEQEDCVEDDEEALPEPPKFTLQRRPASLGSIDDFPSEAIDLASKVISINNDPNTDVFDSMDGRAGAISFGKKKRCQKKVKGEKEEEKGFRGLQQRGKDTYLIIKML